ncbi:MAG: uroporphyrinogen-III synthase [Acidimicrobiia bacterium]|nr:uroporphyrinogen-III synthase [Acidimicrobiia bacterium]
MIDRPRVVLTRAAEHNFVLAKRLDELGIEAVDVPMIEVRPPVDDGRALEAAVAGLDLYHWLVVTSANGVMAVAEMMQRIDVPWPDHLKVAAVGAATAEVAKAHGWPVDFVPTSATAKDLALEFPPSDHDSGPSRVLAALAELGAATVKQGLGDKGYRVDHVIAYRTVAPGRDRDPELEAEVAAAVGAADAVTFTSPSTVTRFIDRFGLELVPPVVVVIGPRTAKRCRHLEVPVTAVADPHNEDGLIAALQAALAEDAG